MSCDKTEIILEKAVSESISTLLSEFGFHLRKDPVWKEVYAESDLWQIRVACANTYVAIGMRLLSEARDAPDLQKAAQDVNTYRQPLTFKMMLCPAKAPSKELVDLFLVLEALAPGVPESDRYPRYLSGNGIIPGEINRQLRLLVEHCRPLLEGDIEQWSIVREIERYGFGTKQTENETRDQYIIRLRETAQGALRRKEYWKADSFYGLLALVLDKMSIPDRIRWWRASRHIFLLR